MLVRLVYSILGTFESERWRIATGSVTTLLLMGLLEEIMVVCVLLGTGFVLKSGKGGSTGGYESQTELRTRDVEPRGARARN